MIDKRRYFAEPVGYVVTHSGNEVLAINQRKPAWASLNKSAASLLNVCGEVRGQTLADIHHRYRRTVGNGPISDISEVAQALADLESAGLVTHLDDNGTSSGLEFNKLSPTADNANAFVVEHLYLELLARCNLRCRHCYMSGSPERREQLEAHEVISLISQFKELGGQYATLSGGEPLLYSGFADVARELVEQGLNGTVITNGTALRSRHIKLLSELDIQLAISLDGMSPTTNDAIRGIGTYNKILRAIDLALAGLGPDRVILSFTPSKLNLSDLPYLFEFARERGIRRINLSLIERAGRGAENWDKLEFSEAEREQLVQIVYNAALDSVGILEVDFNDTRNILEVFTTDNTPDQLHPLWRGVRLNSSGDCYPSAVGSEGRQFWLGNVRDTTLADILSSPVLARLYQGLTDRFQRIPKCRSCVWKQLCRGGRLPATFYATGELYSPDTYCSGYLKTYPAVALRLARLEPKRP